jgi:DNA-binding response OmpR family regulator
MGESRAGKPCARVPPARHRGGFTDSSRGRRPAAARISQPVEVMSKRILVVDDEDDVTELLEFNLRRAGYDVEVAHDGEQALSHALQRPPDLVVLDVMLPHIDGFGVCELLKRAQATSRVPVILLTAFATEASRVIGLEIGADDYLTKPFSPRELVLRVRRLIEKGETPTEPVAVN